MNNKYDTKMFAKMMDKMHESTSKEISSDQSDIPEEGDIGNSQYDFSPDSTILSS